jgi:hypothetical protein
MGIISQTCSPTVVCLLLSCYEAICSFNELGTKNSSKINLLMEFPQDFFLHVLQVLGITFLPFLGFGSTSTVTALVINHPKLVNFKPAGLYKNSDSCSYKGNFHFRSNSGSTALYSCRGIMESLLR